MGIFKDKSSSFPDIFSIVPTVIVVPMLNIKNSFVLNGSTFFPSPSPNTSGNNFVLNFVLCLSSGSLPIREITQPVRESAFVKNGSKEVSIEMLAPGETLLTV